MAERQAVLLSFRECPDICNNPIINSNNKGLESFLKSVTFQIKLVRSGNCVGTNVGTVSLMARKLTAAFVNSVSEAGKYYDGGGLGLCLRVDKAGYKRWVQRIRFNGRQRDLGLGSPPIVSLADARERALENKRVIVSGGDPFAQRREKRNSLSFAEAVDQVFTAKRAEFQNEKHAKQWLSTLNGYAIPKIGRLSVDEIGVRDILRVLEPIWLEKNPTAKRLQQRMEVVLTWATVSGYREGDNPARWAGNLSEILPKPSKVAKPVHHPALSLRDAPRWWTALSHRDGMGTQALKFLTLNASRSGEVRAMTWTEVDLQAGIWTIPASRMKAGKDHRVPLSDAATNLLDSIERHPKTDLVFYSTTLKPLSDMTLSATMKRLHKSDLGAGGKGYVDTISGGAAVPHGLRSTFRDWAAERGYERDMAELQLAHVVGSDVERAYRRSDMLERRRAMAEAWCSFLNGKEEPKIVSIRGGL